MQRGACPSAILRKHHKQQVKKNISYLRPLKKLLELRLLEDDKYNFLRGLILLRGHFPGKRAIGQTYLHLILARTDCLFLSSVGIQLRRFSCQPSKSDVTDPARTLAGVWECV